MSTNCSIADSRQEEVSSEYTIQYSISEFYDDSYPKETEIIPNSVETQPEIGNINNTFNVEYCIQNMPATVNVVQAMGNQTIETVGQNIILEELQPPNPNYDEESPNVIPPTIEENLFVPSTSSNKRPRRNNKKRLHIWTTYLMMKIL